jgi:lactate dehydrogenase-like 2-hydroxyacid dehydrogenase
MTIGIIGSGAIGAAVARTLARAGIEATISNSRGPDSLKELVRELGPSINAGHARTGGARRYRRRRGQLVEAAGGAGWPSRLGRPYRDRCQ